ncbi:MAG: hypothetical protein JSW39_16740 [Desulfobacterales bacterium]|nr:MAG: hypothetical protein JSW39_16740 [Desulfobacterales bacterium]
MKAKIFKIGMLAIALIFVVVGASVAGDKDSRRPPKQRGPQQAYVVKHQGRIHHPPGNRHAEQYARRYRPIPRPVQRVRPNHLEQRAHRPIYRHHDHRHYYGCYPSHSQFFIGGSIFEPGWAFTFGTGSRR